MKIVSCCLYVLKDLFLLSGLIGTISTLFLSTLRKNKIYIFLVFIIISAVDIIGVFALPIDDEIQRFEYVDAVSFLLIVSCVFILLKKAPVFKSFAVALVFISTSDMLWSFIQPLFPFQTASDQAVISECTFNIIFGVTITVIYIVSIKKNYIGAVSCAANTFPRWIFFVLFLFELACYYKAFGISDLIYNILFSISACMMVVCVIYMFLNIQRLIKKQDETYKRLTEQLLFVENTKKSDEELRSFRHDIKNHFIVLNSLFSKGEYERAASYVDSLCNNSQKFLNCFSTGNSIADSLLTVKSRMYPIEFDGIIPDDLIPSEDICIILGNLLDNAVSALNDIDIQDSEKKIQVNSWVKNGNCIIKISNPTNVFNENKKVYHSLETTKKDKKNHGFGIANIKRSVEKNNGSVEFYSEKGRFVSIVILNGGQKS